MLQIPEIEKSELTALWQQQWPECAPVGHLLRECFKDVWVRFHSLPTSKRYAQGDAEYGVLLERHNTVLDEMFTDSDVYVITPTWTTHPDVPPHLPDAGYWQSLLYTDDPDPNFRTYYHLFATKRSWQSGCIDDLLRDVADEKVADVMITDTQLRRIYHPYDGGADVLLASTAERDQLRNRHTAWLSDHPSGL
ncbi:hypothetical protein [Streptomyces sp. NPDC099088]|uniref:DUF3885 domain-containing protein n=1 Tax=Streptomyces sp. NPDC099088 TaxID=3366101 RepID=UPI003826A30B